MENHSRILSNDYLLFYHHTMIPKRLFSTTVNCLKQSRIPATYYRGGTSRALIFQEKDLPPSRDAWKPIFLGAMGSPDPNGRQLNGMGGGISSLSKICVVRASNRPDADVDFTFVQVGIKNADLDYAGNCGNMTSAIGPYAIESGLVDAATTTPTAHNANAAGEKSALTTVKLYNTNTNKHIHATFPLTDTQPDLSGSFTIDGVAGSAAKIRLDFIDPAGSKTGRLLPTGAKVDVIHGVRTTCIDAGNPCVFVPVSDLDPDLGLHHQNLNLSHILPEDLQSNTRLLDKLELIRQHATIKMGMAASPQQVPASIPKICLVSPPSPSGEYKDLSGQTITIEREPIDITVRAISTQQPHKALPITAGLALSAAARLEGTVVNECLGMGTTSTVGGSREESIRIGHPSGRLDVGARYLGNGKLEKTTVFRTARRLMDGVVYWD